MHRGICRKRIEEKSMIVLDLGSRSLDADRITTVKIDVTRMEEPNSLERVRDTDSEWVDVLVNTFKNRTSSMVAPICCIVTGLKNPGEFDVNKKHEYTYRTIGGNHSRTAFARLLSTISEDPPTHILLRNGGIVFFGSKHFFTSSSFIRYRDTILFADNLTIDEAQFLGNLHNADAELQRKATFMDKLSLARKSWFDEGTDNIQQRWLSREDKAGGDSTVLQEWKLAVLKKLGEGTAKSDMNRLSPMFVTARWPMENYELLVQIDKKYNKKQLKGQSRTGKKARQYEPSNKDSITSGYVTALNGLLDGEIKNLLIRVLNCELEMKGLITEGKEIKKRGRFNFKLRELMGCDDNEQVLKRLGRTTVNALLCAIWLCIQCCKEECPSVDGARSQ